MAVIAASTRVHILLVVFTFLLSSSDSRHIATKETQNQLSDQTAGETTPRDDDDLEKFLEDYYDDLWRYLETWSGPGMPQQQQRQQQKKKKDEGEEKGLLGDYEYMSDMPAGGPEAPEKQFKDGGAARENLTWPNERGGNESYGEGMLEVIKANRESNSQEEYPLRSKQMRLKSIIDQVLSFRGGSPRLNESVPNGKHYNALKEIYEKNMKKIKTEEWTSSYTEKLQSFYPSCELPKNTEEDVWSDPNSMNLLFDLSYPSPQEDSTIMIVTATLRLYKIPQENFSPSSLESSTAKMKWERNQNILPVDDDRQIRVSVYWYTKSLRRHRAVKKKLLDSRMLSLSGGTWSEFNVRSAVRTWKESGKNYGLVVNVEDEDGTMLPADQYIQGMNCSKWTATVRPIPSIIMDRVNQYFIENPSEPGNDTEESKQGQEKHKIYPYQPYLYPIIDLRTREVPNSDVKNMALINSAKKALESNLLSLSRKGYNVTDGVENFLKKNSNLEAGEATKLSRIDKSVPRKSEMQKGGNHFQNVPVGTPGRSEEANGEAGEEAEEEKKTPRMRHFRKQKEMLERNSNSNWRSRSDFEAADHH